MTTKTDWYPPHIKPVREGLYEVKGWHFHGGTWKYWNGTKWGWSHTSARMARYWRNQSGAAQEVEWRGLTEEAK